jgi:gliding motility-associated-like protein
LKKTSVLSGKFTDKIVASPKFECFEMSKKFILLFIFLTLFCFKNFATHIVGGEIYYDCLGGNDYRITLKVYRDCYTGLAPFDSPASIFIFDSSGALIDSVEMPFPGSVVLPVTINNPCFTPPTDVCVEEAVYQTVINLPPIPGGYNITYQRCCRNNTILNLVNPGDVGSTYMAHIPSSTLVSCNNSARYNNFPPIFLCEGVPLNFDHSATDPDGDSLYYELCDPYTGLDPLCPILGPFVGGGCPNFGSPPPYTFVPWLPPYSASYPMSASPVLAVNPTTGLMTGTPNMLGQWVVGVCVYEYRAGVLLDVNKRDFQFNVVACPGLPVASVPQQSTYCFGYNVSFTQNSLNATSYHWDFGDATTALDTSNIFAPSWTYADSGAYSVTLIINPGTLCADTNEINYYIYPLLNPSFVPPPAECFESNSFNFTAGGAFMGNGTFFWDFGPDASPSTSFLQNPTNIVFNAPGFHPVTLTITENGCTESFSSSIQVYQKPFASFGLSSALSCILNPVQFNDSSLADTPLTYLWDFDNGSTSTLQDPSTTYSVVGTYNVSLIITTQNGCKDTVELPAPLNVLPPPVAAFTIATNCFNNQIDFTQTSIGGATSLWDFGDLTTTLDASTLASPSWIYPDSGTYTVTLIVNPGTSCTNTETAAFFVNPPLIPAFNAPPGECLYNNSFDFSPGGSYLGNGTFTWSFGTHASPSSSNLEDPTNIVYDTIGAFSVTITITENGCTATNTGIVNVYPKPDAFFEITTPTGCALNPVHFIDDSQSDTPLTYLWDFGDGTASTLQNPYVSYADSGSYYVTLICTTQNGCIDTIEFPAPLIIYPSPVADFVVSPTYTSIYDPDVAMTDESTGASACEVFWGDGTSTTNCDTIHPYTAPGTYIVTQIVVNSYGCLDTAYAQVIIDPNYMFWIPNAFTPGRLDGLNDVFKPKLIGVHDYLFMIFDRWGEKIFETQDTEEGWNGLYKGKLCTNDVFVYRIVFKDDPKGNHHEYIGRVTLVR